MLDTRILEVSPIEDAGPLPTEAAALFSALADPLRIALIRHLDSVGETCACDLGELFGVAQNLLSYHLKILRGAGLVTCERRGRWAHYSVAPGAAARLTAALPVVAS